MTDAKKYVAFCLVGGEGYYRLARFGEAHISLP